MLQWASYGDVFMKYELLHISSGPGVSTGILNIYLSIRGARRARRHVSKLRIRRRV